jgi:hypothetical protein
MCEHKDLMKQIWIHVGYIRRWQWLFLPHVNLICTWALKRLISVRKSHALFFFFLCYELNSVHVGVLLIREPKRTQANLREPNFFFLMILIKDPLYTARWRVFRLEWTFSIRVIYPNWYTLPEHIYLTIHSNH